MLTEANVRKITDYILLNSYSVNSTGLYNGKSGVALCLFEVSRMLKDDYIEEHAFQLLQESLVSKNEDVGFENGLSGIGFVLNYLIKYKHIDASFEELFQQNLEKIIKIVGNKKKTDEIIQYLPCIYLFQTLDTVPNDLIDKIILKVYNYLNCKIDTFALSHPYQSKYNFLKIFKVFLEILTKCDSVRIPSILFQKYSNLYLKNKIASDFSIGHHMKTLASKLFDNLKVVFDVADINMKSASKSIYSNTMLFSRQINMLFLLHQYGDSYKSIIRKLEAPLTKQSNDKLEIVLAKMINPKTIIFGYESGLTRLLLYQAYLEDRNSGTGTVRYKNIFN